jgi:hypothetical protein
MGVSLAGSPVAPWRGHPAILNRRRQELLGSFLAAAIPLSIALTIAVKVPDPNFFLAAGIIFVMLALVAFAASTRYEVTLTILVLYFGLVDGVIKLETANQLASSLRDLMIAALCIGVLVRIVIRREKIELPPLSGWVIAFAVLVMVEAANPNTFGVLKVIGGFRQHLEWIPFFFVGFYLMRSKARFRKFFILLGVIALANGVVSTIQTQLTPEQLSSWGPGYEQRISGTDEVSGRVYSDSEGTARVRPPALGSDLGFGGFVGVIALPGLLAILGMKQVRNRWLVVLLALGALLAVATSLQRVAVLGAFVAAISLVVLSASAGRRATKVLVGLLVVSALTFALASILAPSAGKGVFSRYDSISPDKAASTSVSYRQGTLSQIPTVIDKYPLGAGLAVAGAGKNFGGQSTATIDGHSASAESQYNYVTLELGLLGLIFWVALSVMLIALAARGLRHIEDIDLRLCLAGIFAVVLAFTIMGFVGPTMSNLPFGPYFWFALGVAAYWFKTNPAQLRPEPR